MVGISATENADGGSHAPRTGSDPDNGFLHSVPLSGPDPFTLPWGHKKSRLAFAGSFFEKLQTMVGLLAFRILKDPIMDEFCHQLDESKDKWDGQKHVDNRDYF